MYFSIFSLTMTVAWVSIFAMFISIFRKRMSVLQCFSIYPLLIVLLFCILRILLPLELPFTTVIESERVLPPIQHFLATPFLNYGYIKISPTCILGTIWFSGVAILIAKHVIVYHRFRHLLNFIPASKEERLYRLLAEADVENQPKIRKIIVHNAVESPAIVGCFHPIIILPDIDFEDEELLGIFIHKMAHYKYKHYFIKLLTESIRILFWWNPLLKNLSTETAHALELHSDKTVCTKLTHSQQRKYLSGILKVLKNSRHLALSNVFSCNLVEETGEEKLKQRFKMILGNYYQNKRKYNFIALVCVLSVFLLSYSFVLQPHSEPSSTDFGNTEVPTSDCNDYFIETKKGYDFYEYPERFITHMDEIPSTLNGMKIYKNRKEIKKE